MQTTGAKLVRFALEQLDVGFVFGIPGVHTTELYDELAISNSLFPVLVTHECSAAFMADAVSRTSARIGTLLVVPGAGLTHAASGIAEAFLDGIPMLVLSGGIDSRSGRAYQLHDIDQQAFMAPITKRTWRIECQHDIVPTLYLAYREAMRGRPGPVYVELPVDVLSFSGECGALPEWSGMDLGQPRDKSPDPAAIEQACDRLLAARHPGLYVGWGARGAAEELAEIATLLGAPVATTLQGLSSFPADHPLHAGMGYGLAAAPAAQHAFEGCDCLLAIGTCFSQVGTGNYSMPVPEHLIHIDIDERVFSRNYPAEIAIAADARVAARALLAALRTRGVQRNSSALATRLARDKADCIKQWRKGGVRERVNPAHLFQAVGGVWTSDLIVVADDGNHTFLTAELLPMVRGRRFISPTDFNCMGYAIPAAIGAKLSNPNSDVLAVVGDGAFLMTGMELLTAATQQLGIVFMVFSDGELAQIAQAQQVPYNRKTCTVLRAPDLAAAAAISGCSYLVIANDDDIEKTLKRARGEAGFGRSVLIDVNIDYSQRTAFTKGIIAANIKTVPRADKLRILGRAVARRVTG